MKASEMIAAFDMKRMWRKARTPGAHMPWY